LQGSAAGLVVVIGAVEGNVGLIAAATVYGSTAAIRIKSTLRLAVNPATVAGEDDTRLQRQNAGGLASFKG
jgi:hypothetical protein